MRHLIVMPVVDSSLMELLDHSVNLLRATNKGAEGELVVRTLRFDLRNISGARSINTTFSKLLEMRGTYRIVLSIRLMRPTKRIFYLRTSRR